MKEVELRDNFYQKVGPLVGEARVGIADEEEDREVLKRTQEVGDLDTFFLPDMAVGGSHIREGALVVQAPREEELRPLVLEESSRGLDQLKVGVVEGAELALIEVNLHQPCQEYNDQQ